MILKTATERKGLSALKFSIAGCRSTFSYKHKSEKKNQVQCANVLYGRLFSRDNDRRETLVL